MSQHCEFCNQRFEWAVPCLTREEAGSCKKNSIYALIDEERTREKRRLAVEKAPPLTDPWDAWKSGRDLS
jgi:hypothetical protein